MQKAALNVEPRGGAARVGQGSGPLGELGLAQVAGGHRPAAAAEHGLDGLAAGGVLDQRQLQRRSHGVARQVVERRPEAPSDDQQRRFRRTGTEAAHVSDQRRQVIGQSCVATNGEPEQRQLSGEPRDIGVDRAAAGQFGADRKGLGMHGRLPQGAASPRR